MKKNYITILSENSEQLKKLEEWLTAYYRDQQCIGLHSAEQAMDLLFHRVNEFPLLMFVQGNLKSTSTAQCIAMLRSNRNLDNTPIIVVSAVLPIVVGEAFLALGADFAFQMPVDKWKLREELARIPMTGKKLAVSV